jgi:DNA-binding MarR family transcriptional regulator
MGAKERITLELITAHLRSLERQGFVVSSIHADGRVRWQVTEKAQRENPNPMLIRLDLDS